MRIISGTARGTKLYTLEGQTTRPTLDRVKESLFNIIQNKMSNSIFLDLSSGSGAIGLEAASRGAKKAILCDKSKEAIKIIHNNECMTLLSNEVIAYTTLAPVSGIVMAGHTSSSIKLNWLPIPGVNAYKVYVYNPQSDKFEYADTTPVNQIVFNNLMPNREYRYKIRACIITEDNEIMGPPSSIVRAETTADDF